MFNTEAFYLSFKVDIIDEPISVQGHDSKSTAKVTFIDGLKIRLKITLID